MPKIKPSVKPDSPFPLRRVVESRDALKSFRPSFRPKRGKSELVRELVDLRGWRENSDVIASQDLDEAQSSQASDIFSQGSEEEPDTSQLVSSSGSTSEAELEETKEVREKGLQFCRTTRTLSFKPKIQAFEFRLTRCRRCSD